MLPTEPPFIEPRIPATFIVDPKTFPRRTTARLLRALGAPDVREAASGNAAFATLARMRRRPGVLIVDADLAEADDFALLRALRQRLPDVPQILMGARRAPALAELAEAARARDAGVFAVLPKPASAEEMRSVLVRAIRQPQQAASIGAGPGRLTASEVGECLRGGWLQAVFQPKIRIAGGEPVAIEALARVLHPTHGLLLPAQFLPAIDSAGSQRALAARIFDEAARLRKRLLAGGRTLPIAVNLSVECLAEPGDAGKLGAYARVLGLAPGDLVLEIADSAYAKGTPATSTNLAQLHAQGYAIALDDAGHAGRACPLEALRAPFTEVKLDRDCLQRLAARRLAETAIREAVERAHGNRLKVCAEGIETDDELALARRLGVDHAQGYLFCRPVSEEELLAWLTRHPPRPAASRSGAGQPVAQ